MSDDKLNPVPDEMAAMRNEDAPDVEGHLGAASPEGLLAFDPDKAARNDEDAPEEGEGVAKF